MWSAFKDLIFSWIEALAGIVGDWGLAILIITIIFRVIVAPIMFKQAKSTYMMQKVQPLVQEVQKRYEGDPVRTNEEVSKIYAETKFNPLAGCVPMLLQMPIFMAMFQTLRELGQHNPDGNFTFYTIVPNLTSTPHEMFSHGFIAWLPYLTLMLIFALATFLPMILQNLKSDAKQRNQMLMMAGVMSIMMLWISWNSPAGVLLFWGMSSIFAVIQQQISMRHFKKVDAAKEAAIPVETKPVRVEVERKVKKKRPTKKR